MYHDTEICPDASSADDYADDDDDDDDDTDDADDADPAGADADTPLA